MQDVLAQLLSRDRTLVLLSMVTGLCRGELAGLKWQDIDFANLQIYVQRSVVDQVVGREGPSFLVPRSVLVFDLDGLG